MNNIIQFNGIEFYVNREVILCKIYPSFFTSYNEHDIEEIFYNAVSILNFRNDMPLLLNLDQVSSLNAVNIFRLISNSAAINALNFSRIFISRSQGLKSIFSYRGSLGDQNIVVEPYSENSLAIVYAENKSRVFNKLN
ncbi:hypothetical protein [Lacinutrix sp. 5H-3-7-4]|uniref:hypothetical protein n=1 Tax=Lacinutrix sp. (strain 5H-3-7-4) TaxID=983544 RepID=UPI00020A34F2|nr:hypothetical protein [Lacinutrix sp. 5H-3-7-4]AEH02651.1 hypothetical protein Lacal_2812 [Lacinutrix sp. 5H-3-7-4]